MSKAFQTKEFKKLKSEWYKKLEQSGFKDIEAHERSEYEVIDTELRRIKSLAVDPSRAEWYRCVARYAHSNLFERKVHKAIYQLYAEQLPHAEIARKLSGDPTYTNEPVSPMTVWRVVRKYDRRLKALIKAGTLDKALEHDQTT